jgi:hypothetical protein
LLCEVSLQSELFDRSSELTRHALGWAHGGQSKGLCQNALATIVTIQNLDCCTD